MLVVAYLAVGELLLVLPGRTVTRMAAATMLFLTFAAAAAVLAARVDGGELARAGATPPNDALEGPWPAVMAIGLNSAGTVVLLAGSLLSARRRRDPRPLLVAAGVAVIALASTATRLGSYTLFALGQAAGVTLILLGPGYAETFSPADDPGGLGLAPGGGVAMDRVPGGRAVDEADTGAACAASTCSESPASTASSQPPEERLDLRAVAQVLEALPRRRSHALCLLLRVGHRFPSD